MDDDILTFEQLRNLQQQEQEKDTLHDLDEDFFARVNQYLERKKQVGDHLDNREYRNARHIVEDILDSRQKKILRLAFLSVKSDLQVDNLLPEEAAFLDRIRDQIEDHRDEVEHEVFSFEKEDTEQEQDDSPDATDERTEDTSDDEDDAPVEQSEEHDGSDTEEDTNLFKGSKDEDESKSEPEDEPEDDAEASNDDTMTEIEITAEVPEFMGVDMSVYGPYEPGETTMVPEENAQVLVEKDSAERIE